MINRRAFMKSTGAGMAASGLLDVSAMTNHVFSADTPRRKPNLIFVLADQWRFSAFGHGSDPVVETPHIDRLAAEGANFRNAYATNPVCTPNRSVILTGRYCHQTGMINNNLMIPPTEKCMAEVLQDAGYATHYIGKYHLDGADKPGFVPPGWRRRGFQTFEGFNRGHLYHKSQTFANDGTLLTPKEFEPTYQTNRAIDFIERHQQQPFYLYLSWGPPHTPYAPPEVFDRYTPEDLKWRPNVPENLRSNKKLQRELAGYYGLCTALDHEMGRLTKTLDRLNLADDTIVVFTSDHGDMHGSHGLYRKGHPDEESLHIPLCIRQLGRIAAAQTPATLISSLDLMPTLLSLCGVEAPRSCMGRNLSAAVLGGENPRAESIYCQGRMQATNAWRAVVTEQYKLAMNAAGRVTHLIDLKNDPYELENRAERASSAKTQRDLVALLQETGAKVGDPFPKAVEPARAMYEPTS